METVNNMNNTTAATPCTCPGCVKQGTDCDGTQCQDVPAPAPTTDTREIVDMTAGDDFIVTGYTGTGIFNLGTIEAYAAKYNHGVAEQKDKAAQLGWAMVWATPESVVISNDPTVYDRRADRILKAKRLTIGQRVRVDGVVYRLTKEANRNVGFEEVPVEEPAPAPAPAPAPPFDVEFKETRTATPAPWTKHLDIYEDAAFQVARDVKGRNPLNIPDNEVRTNAMLMSIAPELLAALRGLIKVTLILDKRDSAIRVALGLLNAIERWEGGQ